MEIVNKFCYNTWNIGFIERKATDIISSDDRELKVHWVKHNYKDRFFADPFILDVDDRTIKVLVEDFAYYDKRGMISLLTVDRNSYNLIEKKVVLKQPYHMSYPFVFRKDNGDVWVAPEASQSGNLYYYSFNKETMMLENQKILLSEPLLDSTIVEYNGRWWLFCTKRGSCSNRDLYIYYADAPEGPWMPHKKNPVVSDLSMARPAGYLIHDGNVLYRLVQKCDRYYGEAVNICKIDLLTTNDFHEVYVKELRAQKDEYANNFHTLNGYNDITVVDGLKKHFTPLRRLVYEICNVINSLRWKK